MSVVLLDTVPRSRPHLTKRRGEWVVLIRPGASNVFLAMRWADWKNGWHDWYWSRGLWHGRCSQAQNLPRP